MIYFKDLDIYEKEQILNYCSELNYEDYTQFIIIKKNIVDELKRAGFNIHTTVGETIKDMIDKNETLLRNGFKHFLLVPSTNTTNVYGVYTIDGFIKSAIEIANKTNSILMEKPRNIKDKMDIMKFVISNLIFYKLYAICLFRAIQINHLRITTDGALIFTNLPAQEPTGYEPYYRFISNPNNDTCKEVMDWFYSITKSNDLLEPISSLFMYYVSKYNSDEWRAEWKAEKERISDFSVNNKQEKIVEESVNRLKTKSQYETGSNKDKQMFETTTGVIVSTTINENVMDTIMDEALSMDINYIRESYNDSSKYSFDIPAKYKFALVSTFETFNTATLLTKDSEKFLVEDGNHDVYLLYMKDDSLRGVSIGDSSPYQRRFVEFGDLDIDSDYDCYLPEDE